VIKKNSPNNIYLDYIYISKYPLVPTLHYKKIVYYR